MVTCPPAGVNLMAFDIRLSTICRSGGYTARTLFGWGDGSINPVPAEIAAGTRTTALSLTAGTGARLQLAFDDKGASGTYQAAGQAAVPVRFERLREAVNYGALLGIWRAQRGGETRIFDVKRVLTAGGGAVFAVAQLGFEEKPDEMRPLVAPVTGDLAAAQIRWSTAETAVELKRSKAAELAGTFRHAGRSDKIVFKKAVAPAPSAGTGSEIGQRFPDFTLTAMDGSTVKLSDFRGRPVIVNMFQAWCIWCIDEFSVWRALPARYGDRVVVLPVVYNTTSIEWMQQSARAKNYGVPIYGAPQSPVSFQGIPRSWILDKDGIVVDRIGYLAAHHMFPRIDKALAAK
jgi:thiol-disulfide isomerase/thioredoxin